MGDSTNAPQEEAEIVRRDGAYENVFLAVGTSQDRSAFTKGAISRKLEQTELERLYEGDGLCRRVIDLPAEEMLRGGYNIEGVEDSSEIEAQLDTICVNTKLCDAVRWSRLFGGALVVVLLRDGGTFETPLREDAIQAIEQLRVYDRWQTSILKRYDDPNDIRFGKPELYNVSPVTGSPYKVHESRCLVFDGQPVPERIREENDGWGASVVQQCFDQLTRVNLSHYWANGLLERAQQAVHGIPDLSSILRTPEGEQAVIRRINMVDMARSVNNTVVIDALETYELKSTSFASIADIMDRLGNMLCAVTGIPEALLFGKPQSGLNSTGKSDLENWYAKVAQMQELVLLPALDKIVGWQLTAMGKSKKAPKTDAIPEKGDNPTKDKKGSDYEICFEPLFVPSMKDNAETGYKRAQTFEILVNMGSLDPLEVRQMLPDEGYELDDPDELPEPSPEELERTKLELEGMAISNKALAKGPAVGSTSSSTK